MHDRLIHDIQAHVLGRQEDDSPAYLTYEKPRCESVRSWRIVEFTDAGDNARLSGPPQRRATVG